MALAATIHRMGFRLPKWVAPWSALAGAFCFGAFSFAAVPSANAGTVGGTITVVDDAMPTPKQRNRGFTDRSENPILATKRVDPLVETIVVLEPVSATAESTETATSTSERALTYAVVGESFERPLMPVAVGKQVTITNSSHNTPVLFALDAPDLFDGTPMSPGTVRTITLDKTEHVIEVRQKGSPHFSGRFVAFVSPYFATVKPDGSFEITDVPPGEWTVRVWYKNGWIDTNGPSDSSSKLPVEPQTVSIRSQRSKVTVTLSPAYAATLKTAD